MSKSYREYYQSPCGSWTTHKGILWMKNPYEDYCKKNKLSSPSGFTPQQWSYFQAILNTARAYFKQECGGIDVGFNQVQFAAPKIYKEVYVNVVEWYEDATSAKKLLRKKYALPTKDFRLTPYCHQHCYLSLIPTPKELRRHKKRARRQGKRHTQQQYYEWWNDLQNDALAYPRANGKPRFKILYSKLLATTPNPIILKRRSVGLSESMSKIINNQ